MAFDSEGNFLRVHNWEEDRLNDIGILSDRHDEEDNNFAQGLNDCFLRDGRAALEGNLKMGGNQIKNLADGTTSTDAVTKSQVETLTSGLETALLSTINNMFVLGDIKPSLQSANHGNWLLCDGQAVSRTDYAALFALIGTNFGVGDGVTTFNVPDYRGKFLRGLGGNSASDIYTTQAEGLPNITGITNLDDDRHDYFEGAFYSAGGTSPNSTDSGNTGKRLGFDASRSNAIYGASEHVTPVNMAVNWFIKAKEEA